MQKSLIPSRKNQNTYLLFREFLDATTVSLRILIITWRISVNSVVLATWDVCHGKRDASDEQMDAPKSAGVN